MKIGLVFLVLINISFNTIGQDQSSKERIYTFMNSVIYTSDTNDFNLTLQSSDWIFKDTSSFLSDSTLFSQEDFAYFRLQLEQIKRFKWEEKRMIGIRTLSKNKTKRAFSSKRKDGWENFREKYGGCIRNCSMPIFSEDHTFCIIAVGTQCDWLMGGGGTRVYQKINEKWTHIQMYTMWVS